VSSEFVQHIVELARRVVAAVLFPLVQVLYRESLIWWPFLLSAFALALLVFWFTHGREWAALGEFRRRFLGPAIWAHRSARAEYVFYLVNGALFPFVVAPLLIAGASIGAAVETGLARLFGPIGEPMLSLGAARVAYTVVFFLAYDFGRYLAHNLLHEVPLLWQFHKLHHSAEVLTPFTNFRTHPVELFVMASVPNVTTGLVSGIVWYLSGGEIGFYTFLGLHVGVAAFNTIGNLRHWQVWISFGPVLNRWLISPAHHQIHHSCEPRHLGKNRGFELAVWDRLFGTLYAPGAEEPLRLGLGDGSEGEWHSLGRMYGWPFRDAFALMRGSTPAAPRARGARAGASRRAVER
jgi:sterol desaturase/sphingolipid hydroxylase (fatty acid hydroxylase superfamily)